MLRLVAGFKTASTNEDPVCLYLGHSARGAHDVVDKETAKEGEKWYAVRITEVPVMRKARVSPHVAEMLNRISPEDVTPADGLDELTIEKLAELEGPEGISFTGCKVKQDYIDRVRAFRQLNDAHTVPTLKDLAAAEEVEVKTGDHKADMINAILAARRAKEVTS